MRGWEQLGTYYFSADVRVVLTDECKLRSGDSRRSNSGVVKRYHKTANYMQVTAKGLTTADRKDAADNRNFTGIALTSC